VNYDDGENGEDERDVGGIFLPLSRKPNHPLL
jgi:hypothetical protein